MPINIYNINMELPGISEFLPDSFLFFGTPFAINRFEIIRLVALVFVLSFFCITAQRSYKRMLSGNNVPSKPQSILELGLGFVKDFTIETLGEKNGAKAVPMITTIFFSILFFNLTGIIPGLNLAATASIGIPIIFALWVFVSYWKLGIKEYGNPFKFIKSELFPKGFPVFVYPIYALLEALQLLIIRPASLAIRLFANMMAGHILLALCFAATQFFVFVAIPAMKPFAALTFVGGFTATIFEIIVACLQAYIFSLLACVYMQLSQKH